MTAEDLVPIYEEYIAECSRFGFQAFSPLRLAEDVADELDVQLDTDLPAARQKPRFRGVIRTEITAFKTTYQDQFRVLADAIDADGPVRDHLDAYLDHDPFYRAVDEARGAELRGAIAEDLERIARGLEPLVREDDVWDAVRAMDDPSEARERMLRWFDRPDYLRDHVDHIEMTLDVSNVRFLPAEEIDYSREALRLLDEGRDYMREVVGADVEAVYADEERLSTVD